MGPVICFDIMITAIVQVKLYYSANCASSEKIMARAVKK